MADGSNAEKESGPPCAGPDVDGMAEGNSAMPVPDSEGNPTNAPEPPIDEELQAKFMDRAMSESARLRREAEKFQDKRDDASQRMAGGAARMAALTAEHNQEHFSNDCANPATGAGADDA
eukprot:CAMPEP_0181298690 /NCGR_PEP_ID=MMETSP1101-20121128/5921_1 /TAXON_ID=46948 /ORGANISM="Rhodomonas abbreviata, Strain Caron Lab Isolate" /LENGTH=119 /DNA_ID=CAMNT_0023403737 /DNA_START=78 /DNA_END=437 /DNA_ORIENTATION=+